MRAHSYSRSPFAPSPAACVAQASLARASAIAAGWVSSSPSSVQKRRQWLERTAFDPPRRAGILARDPNRGLALLQKPGLVDHQHAVPIAEDLDHVSADAITQSVRVRRSASALSWVTVLDPKITRTGRA